MSTKIVEGIKNSLESGKKINCTDKEIRLSKTCLLHLLLLQMAISYIANAVAIYTLYIHLYCEQCH